MKTVCADCWAAAQVAYISGGKCWKHATAEERAEHERRIAELVNSDHPLLKMVNRIFAEAGGKPEMPVEVESPRERHGDGL